VRRGRLAPPLRRHAAQRRRLERDAALTRSSSERAFVVADLGFGDAGKGLVVDHLVRRTGARLVVRHNGGAQAGHNVVTPDGRHHCFAQLGAGSFVPGVRTHLSRFFVLHPGALLVEAQRLGTVGVADVLTRVEVDARALVITPFHQAACRLRERSRAEARHGSCGVGVGEAVHDALVADEDALRARDLSDTPRLRRLLRRARDRVAESLGEALTSSHPREGMGRERSVFERPQLLDVWEDATRAFAAQVATVDEGALGRHLAEPDAVIFEGAQGVLLDQDWGFHPHTTWSRCTSENALTLLKEADSTREVTRLGVTRSYMVRHGPGPLPSEAFGPELPQPHNPDNAWQGRLRSGALDLVLLRYALEVTGSVDALVVTHLDALDGRGAWPVVTAYRDANQRIERLPVAAAPTLEQQASLAERLRNIPCEVEELSASNPAQLPDALLDRIETKLGVPVRGRSRGPCADDLELRWA